MVALLSSCSNDFYQIYKTKPISENDSNVFENADCKISYDFWAEGGDAGFTIYNKTSQPITVFMDQSFYIVNGTAYDYFQARTFSTSQKLTKSGYYGTYLYGISLASSATATTENGTAYLEKPQIIIPAKSAKSFREYKINLDYYAHCDLDKFPSRRKIKTLSFTAENSPITFSNSITYAVSGKQNTVVHEFYVSGITNLPRNEELKKFRSEKCDTRVEELRHQNAAPANFFVRYVRK